MADQFVGEIRIFAGNFAPTGWAFCNGQLLPISSNTALFSLLGTYYGGNGMNNFALPNLQGRAAVSQGQGPGLEEAWLGEEKGSDTVTLSTLNLPSHTHVLTGSDVPANTTSPAGALLAQAKDLNQGLPVSAYRTDGAASPLHAQSVGAAGSASPASLSITQPALALNFIIALQGIFPSRS